MILSILHILSVKASCSSNKFKENVNSAMITCSPTHSSTTVHQNQEKQESSRLMQKSFLTDLKLVNWILIRFVKHCVICLHLIIYKKNDERKPFHWN